MKNISKIITDIIKLLNTCLNYLMQHQQLVYIMTGISILFGLIAIYQLHTWRTVTMKPFRIFFLLELLCLIPIISILVNNIILK